MSKVFIFHWLHSNLNKHLRQCFSLLFLCSKASESFNRPATHPLKKRKQSLTNKNAWRLKRFTLGYPFILDCLQSAFFLRSVEVCGSRAQATSVTSKKIRDCWKCNFSWKKLIMAFFLAKIHLSSGPNHRTMWFVCFNVNMFITELPHCQCKLLLLCVPCLCP